MTTAATAASPTRTDTPSGDHAPHWLVIVLPIAVLSAAAGVVVDAGRGTTFFYDEWIWIMERRSPGASSLLEPFNNHLMALPIATYQLFFRVFGLDSQTPYRLMLLAGHLATCGLLYVYLRRRIGWVVALGAASVLAFFGYTWAVIIWPISLGWVYATTAGIAALLLVDRDTRRSDLGACVALLLGVLSSGIAVPFVLGMTVEMGMRRAWRRMYVPGVALVVFGAWYLAYGTGTNDRGSVGQVLEFAENVLAQTVGTLVGVDDRGTAAHVVFVLVGLAVIALWFVLGRPHSPRFVGNVTALAAFTLLLSYSRATSGLTTWHSYAAAVFVLLVMGELLRHLWSAPQAPPPPVSGGKATRHLGRSLGLVPTIVVGAVVVWSLVWNIGQLHDGSELQRFRAEEMRAQLTAMHLGGRLVDPDYKPGRFFLETRAGAYLDVAREYGTPAYALDEARVAPPPARRAGDSALVEGIGLELAPAPTPAGAPCAALEPTRTGEVVVSARRPSIVVSASDGPAELRAGVISSRGARIGRVASGASARFDAPELPEGPRWTVRVRTDGSISVCTTSQHL